MKETVKHWNFTQTYYVPDVLEDFNSKKGIRQNMMRTNVQMFPHNENF